MALTNITTFDLEAAPGGSAPVINASQGDIGRQFQANLYWNGETWTPGSGVTCKLRGHKPDNTVFEYTATISGSTVTFSTTEQMTIIDGAVDCELVFTQNSNVIASANFVLQVEESPYDPNNLSESDVEGLTDVLAGFQRLNRDSNGVIKIGDGVTASGTAEPIKGFYVHDEETDTDGVAKVSIEAVHEFVEDVSGAVDTWLDEHPEATTTVRDDSLTTEKYKDGSVTSEKLNASVSATSEDMAGIFDVNNITVQSANYNGSGGYTEVYYSIIPSDFKPLLYLANNEVNTVQDAGENAADNGLVLSVNAGLFSVGGDGYPPYGTAVGYVIADGEVKKDTNWTTNHGGQYLFMTEDGTLHDINNTCSLAEIEAFSPVWCVKGWQTIYKNGEFIEFSDSINPMAFIGQDEGGNYIVGVTGGRDSGGVGFYSVDIYNFVLSIGFELEFLYVLDGGGSVALTLDGVRTNPLIQNERRAVVNFLGWK